MSSLEMDRNLNRMVAHHDSWAATYDSDILGAMTLYNRITLDNICRFLPEDKNAVILDAGGGTGIWAVELARMGYRVVLTDISPGMLDQARQKMTSLGLSDLVEIKVADIRSMPDFADEQFGMVVCQGDPLSYCGDHQAAVREFARVVRTGGTVLASVDNRAKAVGWIRDTSELESVCRLLETGQVVMWNEREEFQYEVHAFTPSELSDLFEANGLTVERILGKPVIARGLAAYHSEDPAVQEQLFQMELRYCDDPAYLCFGGHLEVAGRKR